MELITPDFGLIFWQTVVLLAVLFILKKFAWKPILKIIKERENNIQHALTSAQAAKKEVDEVKLTQAKLIEIAKSERDALRQEALTTKKNILAQAQKEARKITEKMMAKTKVAIVHEEKMAMINLKTQIAMLSTYIAEKILQKNLQKDEEQVEFVNKLMEETHLH